MIFESYEEIMDYIKDHVEVWHSPEFPKTNPHQVISRTMMLASGFTTKAFYEHSTLILDVKEYMEINNISEATLSTTVIANVKCSFTGNLLEGVSRLTKKYCYIKNGKFSTKISSVKNVDNKNKVVVFFDAPLVDNDISITKYNATWGKHNKGKLSSCNPRLEEPTQFGFGINSANNETQAGVQYLVDVTPMGNTNKKIVLHNINGPAILIFGTKTSGQKYFVNGKGFSFGEWKKNKKVLTAKLKLIKKL
jgi:hypothetical protein